MLKDSSTCGTSRNRRHRTRARRPDELTQIVGEQELDPTPRRTTTLRFRNHRQAEGHPVWLAVYTALSTLKCRD
jgi:hypothetical protein